jgi:DNA invertase Pin-like site-specific DNA recombinase
MVQEVGFAKLQALGIKLVAADSPQSVLDDTPTSKLIRQILAAVSQFDKAMTVAKLRGAPRAQRREKGKCEGRKSHAERNPELVALVKQLHRRRLKGGQRSLTWEREPLDFWLGVVTSRDYPKCSSRVRAPHSRTIRLLG